MQGATPAVQERIASIVGLSRDWIPFLKEGASQFDAQKRAAQDLGIVIDDSRISKAREFKDEWKTAVAAWDLQFKSSLANIFPAALASSRLRDNYAECCGQRKRHVWKMTYADRPADHFAAKPYNRRLTGTA